ncbi:MAG TPA: DUF3667 domain-containing protein [Polyangia bacterium]|nr:DUF3667 domain-containing protein [Polyangia bacterium]
MVRAEVKSAADDVRGGSAHPPECRNCGTLVSDRYCPHCGQSVHDHAKSVGHFFEELLEGFLHLDSRLVRTVRVLFLAPGQMTADYNEGKRAAYVPPVRLYLFVSVLFFVTLAMTGVGLVAIAWRAPGSLGGIWITVDEPESDLADQSQGGEDVNQRHPTGGGSVASSIRALKAIPDFRFFVDLDQWKTNDREAAQLMVKVAEQTNSPRWIVRIAHGIATGSERPDEFNHLFSGHLNKLILLMMPLFALMLAVLYWRQHRYFVEHVTFSIHFHSFIFVVLVLVTLIQRLAGTPLTGHPKVAAWLLAGFGAYLLLSMKRVYGQGWIRTTVKFLLVSMTYFVLFAICFAVVLMWSLPGVS